MANENEDLIHKTITVINQLSTGGRLNPEQQDAFLTLVKDTSVMLAKARFKKMTQQVANIDKLYLGEPVSQGADEDDTSVDNDTKPVFDQVRLEARKLKSNWSISTETIQENIEGEHFEDALMGMMGKRISTDVELLGIQGNKLTSGSSPMAKLLKSADGWGLITDDSHIVDAGGSRISKEILAAASRAMPEQYLQDPDLIWIMSRPVATDWMEQVSNRQTVGGDAALGGNTLNPFGYPVLIVPSIPSRLPVKIGTASPGSVIGAEFGPFTIITGSNDLFKVNVDSIGAVEVVIPGGVYTVVELAGEIRRLLVTLGGNGPATNAALKIYDDGTGRIVLESETTGTASIVDLVATSTGGHSVLPELGLTISTNAGVAAGTATVNEGSFMWLANPKNFIFGLQDETRVYTKFNQDRDRIENVIYNQLAFNVENTEAIVKITNLRRG